jgi:Co/Zn/Cd efflux system component
MKRRSSPATRKNEPKRRFDDPTGLIKPEDIAADRRGALRVVMTITGSMFFIEVVAGHFCGSVALQADALDFLDDMLTYALSIAVFGAGTQRRAAAALFKGALLCVASLVVIGSAIYHMFALDLPRADIMGVVGLLGALVNIGCLSLLAPLVQDDVNVRTSWLTYRHDVAGNIAVVLMAIAVWAFQSPWPDVIVAILASGYSLAGASRLVWQTAKWRGA